MINWKKKIGRFLICCFICISLSPSAHGEEVICYDGLLTLEEYLAKNINSYIHIADREHNFTIANMLYGREQTEEVKLLAQLVYAEARGVLSDKEASAKAHQAAVIWTVLNRVDAGYGTIKEVICAPNQFAYDSDTPILSEFSDLAIDVLERWNREKNGEKVVGRVLPKDYLWFAGNGKTNRFRNKYQGNFTIWDWSLEDPYARD